MNPNDSNSFDRAQAAAVRRPAGEDRWQATVRGAADYRAGQHHNPFFSEGIDADLHLAWTIGYHSSECAAKLRAQGVKPLRGL